LYNYTDGWRVVGEQDYDIAGADVGAADFNGDGLPDLVVAAPGHEVGPGAAYIVASSDYDSADGADGTLDGLIGLGQAAAEPDSWKFTGDVSGVVSTGDVDGDGNPDLLLSQSNYIAEGESIPPTVLRVVSGSRSALERSDRADGNLDGVIDLEGLESQTGNWQVKGETAWVDATDVDGDGRADLIVGVQSSERSGRLAYLINAASIDLNGAGAAIPSLDDASSGSGSYQFLTYDTSHYVSTAVAAAGDVDGDGLGDILIGTYNYGGPSPAATMGYLILAADLPHLDAEDGRVDGLISLSSVVRPRR
ncbi:MAG: FG-GAP repeat protein, partial [Rhodospirillales bacterium]|nr:FG-GAP repeat protein [Rhodospirillales bacterium]